MQWYGGDIREPMSEHIGLECHSCGSDSRSRHNIPHVHLTHDTGILYVAKNAICLSVCGQPRRGSVMQCCVGVDSNSGRVRTGTLSV